MCIIQRLFVYGTLAPGQPNEHVLKDIKGAWEPASVRGRLCPVGWGADYGYPAIVLDDTADEVAGLIFNSSDLEGHWQMLDDFEGDGYRRVLTTARKDNGSLVEVYIYELENE